MEGHALHTESSVHKLQDATNVAFHGGGRRSDDADASSRNQKIQDGSVTVDCKDLTTRYANDVIATCAFGLKVDSQTDKNNSFYLLGKESSDFGFRKMMTFLIVANAPVLMLQLLKLDFLSESCKQGFKKIVLNTMQTREMKNIIRPDMIHLLMEAKKGKLTHDDTKSNDVAAGFATVEESAVGKKTIDRQYGLMKISSLKQFCSSLLDLKLFQRQWCFYSTSWL
uniref:unspecific monooxygenase n=1 Tax=Spodoptera frugiperda TaxID=7108 RepID=A0A2H1VZ42_SPOFR